MNETEIINKPSLSEQELLVQGLRKMADLFEAHPEVIECCPSLDLYCFQPESDKFISNLKSLGSFKKVANQSRFMVDKDFGGGVRLRYFTGHEGVCKKVVTTKAVIEKILDPELVKAVPLVEITRDVQEVTWECPKSILAMGEK